VCDLGGSGYCLWGLERKKVCEKSLGDNRGILGIGVKH
jgi:hypothetical protein